MLKTLANSHILRRLRLIGLFRRLSRSVRGRKRNISASLVIIDDCFPRESSGFRFQEYDEILSRIAKSIVLVEVPLVIWNEWNERVDRYCWRSSLGRFFRVRSLSSLAKLRANGVYLSFLFLADRFLPLIEKYRLPFVFQLYPGGLFALNERASDDMLSKVLSSPFFRGVIVNQDVTADYLRNRFFLKEENILNVYGIPYRPFYQSNGSVVKRGFNVASRDKIVVGFAANKYVIGGRDKGFDIFCSLAADRDLAEFFEFRCAGGFSREDLPSALNIQESVFAGVLSPGELEIWLGEVDIFLNPVRSGEIKSGAFDGFPTTVSVMALFAGCLLLTSDPENNNRGKFTSGDDIIILKAEYHSFREVLYDIVKNCEYYQDIRNRGCKKAREYFDFSVQMDLRMNFLREKLMIL